MKSTRRAAAVLLVTGALAATCTAVTAVAESPTPVAAPGTTPTASAPRTPTASAPASVLDLTEPGVARRIVDGILDAAGTERAIMLSVTATEATVAIVNDEGAAETWGYRNGVTGPVQSDVNYVSQASFAPDQFDLSDVGALFRAGLAVSGSDEGQTLTIVDYSAGLVAMTVTTVPESRTVFFLPDGALLPTLDFTTAAGLTEAYDLVVGGRYAATAVGFGSDGVYVDTTTSPEGAVMRRQRSARTPVIVTTRAETSSLAAFNPATVKPAVVLAVVERAHAAGEFTYDEPWLCEADDRDQTGVARLHCRLGTTVVVTDLAGTIITG